jgi:uncharacterized membrane protein YkvI
MSAAAAAPTWFQRFLLPGLAFKAVVIGGGYATGRELAEFFIGSGPVGGLQGMVLAMLIWSLVCALTFLFARLVGAYDYRSFFQSLLGPFWIAFEIAWLLLLILILAVVSAAAGAIGAALFGWPEWIGTLLLALAIVGVTSYGTGAAEKLFRYSSTLIYVVYALFLVLALLSFGERIPAQLARPVPDDGWAIAGVTYASYNLVAAVAILPFLRHLTSRRDALVAGVLSGPLAMLPAILFFLCMAAYYPEIDDEPLPSDFLLRRIGLGWFHLLFQLMIFCALLETGIGIVNAFVERFANRRGGERLPHRTRLLIAAVLVLGSGFAASAIGLVELIARGYGAFGYIMLGVFVLPLVTIGLWRIVRTPPTPRPADAIPIKESIT